MVVKPTRLPLININPIVEKMAKTHRKDRKDRKERKERKTQRKQEGGKRKGSEWTRKVTALYKKMKKADKTVKFRDALKKASTLKRKGQL